MRYTCLQDLDRVFNNHQFVHSYKLKELLFRFSLKERQCETCKNETWLNQPIKLELHHIDGNPRNNSLNNLQILCPNCHSYTDTFCKRKSSLSCKVTLDFKEIKQIFETSLSIKEVAEKLNTRGTGQSFYKIKKLMQSNGFQLKAKEPLVKLADNRLKSSNKYSSKEEAAKAVAKKNERIIWPNNEILAEMVWQKSVSKLAKEFGVTDNAVRHRCKHRNIPVPPVGYWRKLEVGQVEACDLIRKSSFQEKMVSCPEVESGYPCGNTENFKFSGDTS
jgi:transposase-like protein